MSSIFFFCVFCIFRLFRVPIYGAFPNHDAAENVLENPIWDTRDHPACGQFKAPPPNYNSRIYKGNGTYEGQFPWAVCLLYGSGSYYYDDPYIPFQTLTGKIGHNIWQIGYDFSKYPNTKYELERLASWDLFCTGSIIDNKWILTAAHCFHQMFENWVLVAKTGVTECAGLGGNPGTIREIVLSRLEGHKTLFEPEQWIALGDRFDNYGSHGIESDIALIRLDAPYADIELPAGKYADQLMNRICIYSQEGIGKFSCVPNVYFAGYGLKGNPATAQDPTIKLTYFEAHRVSGDFCRIVSGRGDLAGKYCYSAIDRHKPIAGKQPDITDVDMRNDAELFSIPNTCGGDSGGPFMHYMRINSKNKNGLDAGYRALQLSTLFGIFITPDTIRPTICDHEYRVVTIPLKRMFGSPAQARIKTISVGPMLWNIVNSIFWNSTMGTSEEGEIERIGPHAKVTYPKIR